MPTPGFPGPRAGWDLLRAGVPLTLLCDLLPPDGPDSRGIYASEAVADDVARAHPDAGSTTRPQRSISTG